MLDPIRKAPEGPPPSASDLSIRTELANREYVQGSILKAGSQFEDYIDLVSQHYGKLHAGLLEPYLKLIEIKFREGNFVASSDLAQKASDIVEDSGFLAANGLREEDRVNYSLTMRGALITSYALRGDRSQVETRVHDLVNFLSETLSSPNTPQPYSSVVAVTLEQCGDSLLLVGQGHAAEACYRDAIGTLLSVQPSQSCDHRNLNPIAHRLLRGLANILRVEGTSYDFDIHHKLVSHLTDVLQADSGFLKQLPKPGQAELPFPISRIDNFRFGLALSLGEAGLFVEAQREFPFTVTDFLSSEEAPLAGPDKIALAAWLRAHNHDLIQASNLVRLISEPATADTDRRQYPTSFRTKAMLGFVNLELAKAETEQNRKDILLFKADEQLGGALQLMRIYFRQSMPAASLVMESLCKGEKLDAGKVDAALRMMNRSAMRAYLFELNDILGGLEEIKEISPCAPKRVDLKLSGELREEIAKVLHLRPIGPTHTD